MARFAVLKQNRSQFMTQCTLISPVCNSDLCFKSNSVKKLFGGARHVRSVVPIGMSYVWIQGLTVALAPVRDRMSNAGQAAWAFDGNSVCYTVEYSTLRYCITGMRGDKQTVRSPSVYCSVKMEAGRNDS